MRRYRDSPVAQSPESDEEENLAEEEEDTQVMPVEAQQQSSESEDDDRRGRQRCASMFISPAKANETLSNRGLVRRISLSTGVAS